MDGGERVSDQDDRLSELDRKLDTIAGAVAAVARSQTELLAAAAAQRADLDRALEALATVAEVVERNSGRTDDRLAAIRDAAAVPVADLRALLTARTERTDRQLEELIGRIEQVGPRPVPVEELDVAGAVRAVADDLADDIRDHTDAALAATLRVLDDRLHHLRDALVVAPPPAAGMGFEAGAVMGATQAAWNRLEQRLDADFDDLSHQLQTMAALVEQALATAEAAANRPVVTGEQLRKTATSMKDAVLAASRSRRDRHGGPRSLGPG
ncbi:MAG TPA: hypothetical protein VFV32_01400 [Acidimicrobiales bacterium]|jgi:hypothetical protein|nr:hypothetical protein [Acidimicrobiales bacterium]